MTTKFFIIAICILLISCQPESFLTEQIQGGRVISARMLNDGKKVYEAHCLSCHGVSGDGTGVTYRAFKTRPRNLTQGEYKFGLSLDGGLPSDEDFYRILDHGLAGTAMKPWGLNEYERDSVVEYIKTFAPTKWKGDNYVYPTRPKFSADPYTAARSGYAIERGKEVYHTEGQCFTCHRSYVPLDQLAAMNNDPTLLDDKEALEIKEQETIYFSGQNSADVFKNLPPDFGHHSIRSAKTRDEIYKRLFVGVNGTAMPAWGGVLTDEKIWALAYYIESLVEKNVAIKIKARR